MTRDTAYQRTKRRLQQTLRPWFDAIRIPWFLAWGIGGIGYAANYIETYSWHHAPILWFAPLGAGVFSLVRLYQALVAELTVRAWLRESDDAASTRIESVQPHTRIVPPWTRQAYLKRRQHLKKRGMLET